MRKIVRGVCFFLAALALATTGVAVFMGASLPDTFTVETGATLELAQYPFLSPRTRVDGAVSTAGVAVDSSYNTQLCLFGLVPVRQVRAVQQPRRMVTVCGTPFGIKMFTDGALVVSFSDIPTGLGSRNPARTAGLRVGDVIKQVAGRAVKTNEDIMQALQDLRGAPAEVIFVRGSETCNTLLTAVADKSAGVYRAGIWVRDSSAGIGTLTFADETTGVFAGLGHSVHDADTGDTLSLRTGEIVNVNITGVVAGTAGAPGELKGRFADGAALGTIVVNGESGVYGKLSGKVDGTAFPVAFPQEVQAGQAHIWADIDGTGAKEYAVTIEKISLTGTDENRNMVVRVTDERLLAATGGIVQGMSGSPVMQNGRLVGAITHVLVNDPTRGYAIFAETMLQQADAVSQHRAA